VTLGNKHAFDRSIRGLVNAELFAVSLSLSLLSQMSFLPPDPNGDEPMPGPPLPSSDELKTYLHPDSPNKVAHHEADVDAKFSTDVLDRITTADIQDDKTFDDAFGAVHWLSRAETPEHSPRLFKLCETLAECLVVHHYSAPVCPQLYRYYPYCMCPQTWQSNCPQYRVDRDLPKNIALSIGKLTHSAAMTHLSILLRGNGLMPTASLELLSRNMMPSLAIWVEAQFQYKDLYPTSSVTVSADVNMITTQSTGVALPPSPPPPLPAESPPRRKRDRRDLSPAKEKPQTRDRSRDRANV
jgi:hypothetical protein